MKIAQDGVIASDLLTDEFSGYANTIQNYASRKTDTNYGYAYRPDAEVTSSPVAEDMLKDYNEQFTPEIKANIKRYFKSQGLDFVVDAMYGSTSLFLDLFRSLGAKVVRTDPMSMGTYPKTVEFKDLSGDTKTESYRPEPLNRFLSKDDYEQFEQTSPDGSIYIALDGDGDRMVVWVKREGKVVEIRPNELSVLFGYHILDKGLALDSPYIVRTAPTTKALDQLVKYFKDVKSQETNLSRQLKQYYASLQLVKVPVGSKHFADYVMEGSQTQAAVAFEQSGHQATLGFFDDAVFEALFFLQVMAERSKHPADFLNEIYKEIGYDLVTGETAVSLPNEQVPGILEQFQKPQGFAQKLAKTLNRSVESIDVVVRVPGKAAQVVDFQTVETDYQGLQVPNEGLTVFFTDGTLVTIRKSGTEPKFRVYVEAPEAEVNKMMLSASRVLSDNASLVQEEGYDVQNEADRAELSGADGVMTARTAEPVKESYGGINLNEAMLDLNIKRDGQGIILPVSDQPVEELRRTIPGFTPIIVDIRPIAGIPQLLSVLENKTDAAGDDISRNSYAEPMDRIEQGSLNIVQG